MAGVSRLELDRIREALRLVGGDDEPPATRGAAQRALRRLLLGDGVVRSLLDQAPEGARAAFMRLADDGPARVEDLLGRGWWGHGILPPPLDWLQRRALVRVDDDGRVVAVEEARAGFTELTLPLGRAVTDPGAPVRVEDAHCVVVAADADTLDRALVVADAGLRAVATTVALSARSADVVRAALRAAGVALAEDVGVAVVAGAPALPGTSEDGVGPAAIRGLLERAVTERRQVRLRYFASSRGGAATERVVEPWSFRDDLLRGYCHLRQDERSFAVDRIGHARLLPSPVTVSPPDRGMPGPSARTTGR